MNWKCSCGNINEIYNLSCENCSAAISNHERTKIYNKELWHQIRVSIQALKDSVPVKAMKYGLLKLVAFIKNPDNIEKKIAIIPITFFIIVFINIIAQIAGINMQRSARMLAQRREISYERRVDFTEQVRLKIDNAFIQSGFTDTVTESNLHVKEHFEEKKNHLAKKTKIAAKFISEKVKRGIEICRKYLD